MRYQNIRLTALVAAAALLSGCGAAGGAGSAKATETTQAQETQTQESGGAAAEAEGPVTNLSQIDNSKWQYNADDGVYWQVGILYCETPAAEEYETLGVFVPEVYLEGKANGDGTYTCTLDLQTEQGGPDGPDGMGGPGGHGGPGTDGAAAPAQGGYVDENGQMQNDGIVRNALVNQYVKRL